MIDITPEENWKAMIASLLMKRLAVPKEVADAAAYLCSTGGSYITGTSMEVAGEFHA